MKIFYLHNFGGIFSNCKVCYERMRSRPPLYYHSNWRTFSVMNLDCSFVLLTLIWRRVVRNYITHHDVTKWKHFPALLVLCVGNSPVTSKLPTQRPVTRSFDVSFKMRLNKRLSKQSWGWWFDMPSRLLWRHRNAHLCCHWCWRWTSIAKKRHKINHE